MFHGLLAVLTLRSLVEVTTPDSERLAISGQNVNSSLFQSCVFCVFSCFLLTNVETNSSVGTALSHFPDIVSVKTPIELQLQQG